MLQINLPKKGHGRLIAADRLVLPLGFGKFGMSLRLIFKKQGHRLLIAAAIKLLPYGSGNFGHDSSLGKFDVNWGNF